MLEMAISIDLFEIRLEAVSVTTIPNLLEFSKVEKGLKK